MLGLSLRAAVMEAVGCSPSRFPVCPQTLLPAASLLQLNGVRDACCKFLLSQLDPSNCLGIRGFADTHSCSDLLKSAHKYVLQHFVEVSKTEEFMLLPLKQVRPLPRPCVSSPHCGAAPTDCLLGVQSAA